MCSTHRLGRPDTYRLPKPEEYLRMTNHKQVSPRAFCTKAQEFAGDDCRIRAADVFASSHWCSLYTAVRCVVPLLLLLTTLFFSGCAHRPADPATTALYLSPVPAGEQPGHAPAFLIRENHRVYNRIGTPAVLPASVSSAEVIVDPAKPSIYFETATFIAPRGQYRNLIYRLHFSEVPFGLCKWNLTAGKNPGLLIIYTLDQNDQLLLVTTVHTCGCYLAFLPTQFLDREAFPKNWPEQRQRVYGYELPALLDTSAEAREQLIFTIADQNHRISAVTTGLPDASDYIGDPIPMELLPLGALYHLPFADGELSFFETEGPRAGYVKNNTKILERLLIGWWAFDWRVGEDKAYGQDDSSPAIFYTSLKFWARKASDLKNFPAFLEYWGWRL
jgi:hypothetical protein